MIQKLDTITKFEADRLVQKGIVRDVSDALIIGSTLIIPAGVLTPLWNFLSDDYKARMGHQILEFHKLFSVPENIDYDKFFTYTLACIAITGAYLTVESIYSAISSHKQYKTNPESFIKGNFDKELV